MKNLDGADGVYTFEKDCHAKATNTGSVNFNCVTDPLLVGATEAILPPLNEASNGGSNILFIKLSYAVYPGNLCFPFHIGRLNFRVCWLSTDMPLASLFGSQGIRRIFNDIDWAVVVLWKGQPVDGVE